VEPIGQHIVALALGANIINQLLKVVGYVASERRGAR
jgi:hypothetical protein